MNKEDKPKIDYPQNRVEFYNTFSLLIRMGSSENKGDKNPRRQVSDIVSNFSLTSIPS